MNFENVPKSKDQKFETWFKNHYLFLILGFLFIYSGLPVLAPILIKAGINLPAKLIYWAYSFLCHQLPYRSWFLFGTQAYYPLEMAGIKNILTFESVFRSELMDYDAARSIIGNSYAGYKIAICQRDVAIYWSLFLFGLYFASKNQNIKRIPFWGWIVFGVIPIGLDGITQSIGKFPMSFLGTIMRESTPLLRTITGCLFGILTGWYIFPTIKMLIDRNISNKSGL